MSKFSFPEIINPSQVDWYDKALRDSLISRNIADAAGFVLRSGYYEIPYYDIHGRALGVTARRWYRAEGDKGPRYSRGHGAGKGIPPLIYWPQHPSLPKPHSTLIGASLDHQIWITEGEKKALCLQSQLLAQGIPASALAMPGVSCFKYVQKELEPYPMHLIANADLHQRTVVLCYDWNKDNKQVRNSEAALYTHFSGLGAKVVVLRWPVEEDAGEQKIDDYLADGGQLASALEYTEANPYEPPDKVLAQFNDLYAVYNGKIVMLERHGVELSSAQFKTQTENVREWDPGANRGKGAFVPVSTRWLAWGDRNEMLGRRFAPPVMGETVTSYDGGWFNISPRWPTQYSGGDSTIMNQLVRRFCENDEQYTWFCLWLTHAAMMPAEGTSQCVAISDDGGTGKGILFSALRSLFGKFAVDPVDEEMLGRFNVRLAGSLLALVDEPPTKNDTPQLERFVKGFVGNKTHSYEGKGTVPFMCENYMRILVSMNTDYATRLRKGERRWNYFRGVVMDKSEQEHFGGWVNGETVTADVQAWVREWAERLGEFKPYALGPESSTLRLARELSQSPTMNAIHSIYLEGKDIWEAQALWSIISQLRIRGVPSSDNQFFKVLKKEIGDGCCRRVGSGSTGKSTLYCLRNLEEWEGKTNADWQAEAGKGGAKH